MSSHSATRLRPLRGRNQITHYGTGGVAALSARLIAATPPGSEPRPETPGAKLWKTPLSRKKNRTLRFRVRPGWARRYSSLKGQKEAVAKGGYIMRLQLRHAHPVTTNLLWDN